MFRATEEPWVEIQNRHVLALECLSSEIDEGGLAGIPGAEDADSGPVARVEFENLSGEGVGDACTFQNVVSVVPNGVVAGEGRGIPGRAHEAASLSTAATFTAVRPNDSWTKRSLPTASTVVT